MHAIADGYNAAREPALTANRSTVSSTAKYPKAVSRRRFHQLVVEAIRTNVRSMCLCQPPRRQFISASQKPAPLHCSKRVLSIPELAKFL
jgi:hypothetical protein